MPWWAGTDEWELKQVRVAGTGEGADPGGFSKKTYIAPHEFPHMNRRAFIGLVGAALTTGLAGCTGSNGDESSVKSTTGVSLVEADDGSLAVDFGVINEGDEEVTETVTVRATIDGEAHTQSENVTLAPGEEETIRFVFDTPYDEAIRGDFEVRGEIGE